MLNSLNFPNLSVMVFKNRLIFILTTPFEAWMHYLHPTQTSANDKKRNHQPNNCWDMPNNPTLAFNR